jgi:hypothetical protein
LQPEAVSQPGQVVEDANDMRDLKARLVIEAQVSQRLPIFFNHSRWRCAEFLCDRTECAVARRKLWHFPPAFVFDCFD